MFVYDLILRLCGRGETVWYQLFAHVFYDFVTSSIFHVLVPDHPFWSSFHSTNNGERELQEGGEEIPTETRPEGETWRALDHMDIQVDTQ